MNQVQQTIERVIKSIPYVPYLHKAGITGVTEDLYWQGEELLSASNPVRSYCVGAVFEVLVKVLQELDCEHLLTLASIKKLRQHTYIFNKEEQYDGIAGALVAFELADWVDDPEDAEYGDFAQFWHESDDEQMIQGHSVIITGTDTKQGRRVITDWSASPSQPNPGHKYDWHLMDHTITHYGVEYKRTWHIARLRADKLGLE